MAEEVEIGNIGGANGVASEVTLVRLTAAMESMAKAQGGGMDPKKAQAILKENYRIIQEATYQQKEKNKEEKKNEEPPKRFRKALNGATKSILSFGGAVSGQLLGSVTNFSKALFGSEDTLESFAKTVPFVGGILGSFAGILDTNLAAFRSLSESGATFGVGLNGLRLAAANAARLVSRIAANAPSTPPTNGTVFAKLSKLSSDPNRAFEKLLTLPSSCPVTAPPNDNTDLVAPLSALRNLPVSSLDFFSSLFFSFC